MSVIDRAKVLAEIVKLGSEVYGLIVDKALARSNADRDHKIAELEAQIADLKRKASR